jgi:hypothetical protein
MGLHDAIHRLFGRLDVPTGSCIKERDIARAREIAATEAPGMSSWYALPYPGEQTLPVYLLPVVRELPESLHGPMKELKGAMQQAGAPLSSYRGFDLQKDCQVHVWLASLAKGVYLPIGQVIFVREERRRFAQSASASDSDIGEGLRLASSSGVDNGGFMTQTWWLRQPWLRPAYRCQKIFRSSVPYFKEWHPGFLLKDPPVVLARSLKDYPEHISNLEDNWYSGD